MTDDDRVEQAFRDAFHARADALEPEPLSTDAAPRHRRTWPKVLTAAAAVVVVALGTFLVSTNASKDLAPDDGGPTPPAVGLPDGWHWESHANVEVGVPDSWGYFAAPGADWCAFYDGQGNPNSHRVTVPRGPYVDTSSALSARLTIGCMGQMPASLMVTHLTFLDRPGTGDDHEIAGWTAITRAVGATHVELTTDRAHEDLARQVLATAHVVQQDQNGCPVSSPIQAARPVRPDPAFDVTRLTGVDSIAVCQYLTHGTGRPGLLASRRLTGAAADSELSALRSAPAGGGPDNPQNCIPDGWGDTGVVLRLTSGERTDDMYGYYEWCTHNGFDDGTTVRELTTDDCQPLWGGRVMLFSGSTAPFGRCRPDRSGS
jgi:hypothetical protein